MRTFLLCSVLFLMAFVGYAYYRNPEGCKLVAQDFCDLISSISPVQVQLKSNLSPTPADTGTASTMTNAAPVTAASPTPDAPPPVPVKRWTPPDPFPAQADWTWATTNGKSYQNVVVTAVTPSTVSITHALGAAVIPLVLLPPDLQKQLNYDPEAAVAERAEIEREKIHPYYPMSSLAEAKTVARQLHWPLAWVDTLPELLKASNPVRGSDAELTLMAFDYLKTRAVVIFVNGNQDLAALSPLIRDQQLFQLDDGPMPGGHHFYAPKIVFSDPDVTRAFGRVSHTQMAATREAAIDLVLDAIARDAAAQALLNGPTK